MRKKHIKKQKNSKAIVNVIGKIFQVFKETKQHSWALKENLITLVSMTNPVMIMLQERLKLNFLIPFYLLLIFPYSQYKLKIQKNIQKKFYIQNLFY